MSIRHPPARGGANHPPARGGAKCQLGFFPARRRLQLDSAHKRHQRLSLHRENVGAESQGGRILFELNKRGWCQGVFHNPLHCLRQDNVADPVH